MENKKVEIEFDEASLKILKGVNKIHRDSLISIGLSLASRTSYYQTLTGKVPEELNNVASLDELVDGEVKTKEEAPKETPKVEEKKNTSSWDDF